MLGGIETQGIQLPELTSSPLGYNGAAFASLQNLKENKVLELRPEIVVMM